jgi:hypothetical protein
MRKTVTIACVMVLLVFAAQASAADNTFTNGNSTGLWSDPLNWSAGWVPINTETAYIGGGLTCTLDSYERPYKLRLGTTAGTGKLLIEDGTDLFVDGHVFIAMYNDAEIVQNGGYFKIPDTNIPNWTSPGFNGTYTLNGGNLVMESSNSSFYMHEDGSNGDTALINQTGGTANLGNILMYQYGTSGGGASQDCLAEFRVSGGTLSINGVYMALSHAEATDSVAKFHVIGSAGSIAANSWSQTVGNTSVASIESILHCELDCCGVSTIGVAGTATFTAGTTAMVEAVAGITHHNGQTFDLLTADFIDDQGLAFHADVDTSKWSFAVTSGTAGNATDNGAITVTYIGVGTFDGDLNCDSYVDGNDLDIVLAAWGQSVPPADPRADISGDFYVDGSDLDYILSDWGQGTPPPVPEPITLTLLGFGGLALLRRRRR